MGRRTKAFTNKVATTFGRREPHHDDGHRDQLRGGQVALQGALTAYGGHGNPPQPPSHDPRQSKVRHPSQKAGPARGDSYPQQFERPRTNEPGQQHPSRKLHTSSKLLPRKPEEVGSWEGVESQSLESRSPVESGSDSAAVMGRIYHYLRKARFDYPSAQFGKEIPHPCSAVDIEKAVLDLIQVYGSIYQGAADFEKTQHAKYESLRTQFNYDWVEREKEFKDKFSKLEREREREKDRLEAQISILRDEHATREQRHDDKIKKIEQEHQSEKNAMADKYKDQIQRLESEMDLLKNRHEGKMSELEQQHREQVAIFESATREEIAGMQKEFDTLLFQSQESLRVKTEHYEMRLGKIGNEHEEEMRQMASSFNTEKAQMNQSFLNEKARLSSKIESQRETYETRLTNLRRQNEDDKQRMMEEYQDEKTRMGKRFNEEMERKNEEIKKISMNHEAEKREMVEVHAVEKVKLEHKREQEHKDLKNDVEALMGALVKRDRFKVLTDHELAHRFQDLASEVDEFARVRWDNRRERTWPFPDELLRNSENERRTKQHAVQNTIWVILHEKIFCTPFRVLGNEGKSLEREWIEKYGQDRTSTGALTPCPKPTKDSEKWRYEKMKKCHEAIGKSVLESEPGYNAKQGYELSVREVIQDISQELGRVASVSGDDRQRIIDLARKAATLWLEIGEQRCRIFLLMSRSGEMPLRSGQAALDGDGRQEQVVVPELRRLGNAQGERLERNELVSDCRGKFSVFCVR